MRLDGARHWRKTLDQIVWMMLRGGATPAQITEVIGDSLHRHRYTQALVVPPWQVLEYSRVITQWSTDTRYLGEDGSPLTLPVTGRGVSFRSLVRKALPRAEASDVLKVLARYNSVRRLKGGRVQFLSNTLLPNGGEQALFLGYTLSALEGVVGTCYANLNIPDSTQHLVQRMAIAERFDMSRGREFDAYSRETTPAMLASCDAWTKRREIKGFLGSKDRAGYAGVVICWIKAR
jgi:hypothetical protein